MVNIIDKFYGKYEFLSNFYYSPIIYKHIKYPTVEHAFQALKSQDISERHRIALAKTPGIAKRMGRKVQLRPDWEDVKVKIMKLLVKLKFTTYEDLKKKLLATSNVEIIEGNTWKDTFWGVCEGRGLNMLGKILMEVREELR